MGGGFWGFKRISILSFLCVQVFGGLFGSWVGDAGLDSGSGGCSLYLRNASSLLRMYLSRSLMMLGYIKEREGASPCEKWLSYAYWRCKRRSWGIVRRSVNRTFIDNGPT
jgi:hypothetical protein